MRLSKAFYQYDEIRTYDLGIADRALQEKLQENIAQNSLNITLSFMLGISAPVSLKSKFITEESF